MYTGWAWGRGAAAGAAADGKRSVVDARAARCALSLDARLFALAAQVEQDFDADVGILQRVCPCAADVCQTVFLGRRRA